MSTVEKEFTITGKIVGGVTFDGHDLWMGLFNKEEGARVARIDRETGEIGEPKRTMGATGNAWDGKNFWQSANSRKAIQCLDPQTFEVIREIPSPHSQSISGMAWDGESLWVGVFDEPKMYKLDPSNGAILKTIDCNRYVTGVAWVADELWHATHAEENQPTELRKVDTETGAIKESVTLPYVVSGLSHDGETFWCGDCAQGKLRAIRV